MRQHFIIGVSRFYQGRGVGLDGRAFWGGLGMVDAGVCRGFRMVGRLALLLPVEAAIIGGSLGDPERHDTQPVHRQVARRRQGAR